MGAKFTVGDRVINRRREDWNIGTVQSVSDETGLVTCAWNADHGFFQAAVHPAKLRKAFR